MFQMTFESTIRKRKMGAYKVRGKPYGSYYILIPSYIVKEAMEHGIDLNGKIARVKLVIIGEEVEVGGRQEQEH